MQTRNSSREIFRAKQRKSLLMRKVGLFSRLLLLLTQDLAHKWLFFSIFFFLYSVFISLCQPMCSLFGLQFDISLETRPSLNSGSSLKAPSSWLLPPPNCPLALSLESTSTHIAFLFYYMRTDCVRLSMR